MCGGGLCTALRVALAALSEMESAPRVEVRFRAKGGLMAPITTTSEIARPAEEVFAYVTDPSKMPECQTRCVRGHMDGPAARVYAKGTTDGKVGMGEIQATT